MMGHRRKLRDTRQPGEAGAVHRLRRGRITNRRPIPLPRPGFVVPRRWRDFWSQYLDLGPPPPPESSPFYRGRFGVGRAIIGGRTVPIPIPEGPGDIPRHEPVRCSDGLYIPPPQGRSILAAVYYPALHEYYDYYAPIQINPYAGAFPVVLYAHARRPFQCPQDVKPPLDPSLANNWLDYTRVEFILDHVASQGCIVVAPDFSGLGPNTDDQRATWLLAVLDALAHSNAAVFSKRLDLGRVVLIGHSTGGGASLSASPQLTSPPVALGLLAPAPQRITTQPAPLLVLKGTRDTRQGAMPDAVYAAGAAPKALVTVEGANHFGYTDICAIDNQVCAADDDPGTISGLAQKIVGAAYLSALVRWFALEDATAEPYLQGRPVEGLELVGARGITVDQVGV